MSEPNVLENKKADSWNMILTVFEMILKNRQEIKGIDIDIMDDEGKDPQMKIVFTYDLEKLNEHNRLKALRGE